MTTQNEWLLWAPAASAAASAIAAIVAAVNVWIQNRNARRSRAIDLLLKKETEFDNEVMRKKRVTASKALLAGTSTTPEICSVLDFMESVAALVADGDLEDELAWRTFYYWFSHYFYAANDNRSTTKEGPLSVAGCC
ncbi:MAG: DUF4760 domain-containing protein [Burkholderiaceae bacterium]